MALFILNGEEYATDDPAEVEELRANPDVSEIHERSVEVELEAEVVNRG